MAITIGQIRYDLFQINETDGQGLNVDAYLIIGSRRALLVDTLQESEEIYSTVRRLTGKPFDAVITHAHIDHAGKGMKQLHEAGVPLWCMQADIDYYHENNNMYPFEWFSVLEDGQKFDLGGTVIETIALAGHTPGSAVLLDRQQQRLFSSDAVGSGYFWMQIPGCTPLHEFHDRLARFTEEMDRCPGLRIYPGHRYQSDTQLGLQYLHDTLTLTGMILSGTDRGEDREMLFKGAPIHFRECSYGMMKGYCYNPDNL